MGDLYFEKLGSRSSATGTGTTAGVTVTVAGSTGYKICPLMIAVSGDAAAVATIESPSGTVLWQERFAGAFTKEVNFDPGDIQGTSGAALLLKISASSAHCEANISYGTILG